MANSIVLRVMAFANTCFPIEFILENDEGES